MTMTHPRTADEWLEAVHREFARETDRAAAIVAAAMLDEALRVLIDKRLVPAPSPERSILERHDAALGSFAARIDAAFQLGLISKYMARDLHLVRKIRNEFAHYPLELTFEADAIRDRFRALDETADYNRREPATRTAIGPPGPRWDFFGIAAWMLYALHREDVDRLVEHGPEFGYMDWTSLPEAIQEFLRSQQAT